MKLTEQTISGLTLRPGEDERLIADDAMTGLRLRLRQGAKGIRKSWVFKYSVAGQQRSFTFDGPLTAARKWAGELQAKKRLGQDPAQDRSAGHQRAQETMAAVLPAYLEGKRLTLKPRSYAETERHLLRDCKSLHGHPLRAITPVMVATRYGTIAKTSGATTATNVWRALHAFLGWSMRQGYLDRNPAIGVERRPICARSRVLSADEIKAIWAATKGVGDFNAVVRLLLLSGCRLREITDLRAGDEIYSDRFVIGSARTKNGHAHTVPLLPAMRAILAGRERRGEYVFGRTDRGFSGTSGSKAALDQRIKAAGVEMKPWVLHDLRRTFATGLGELGIPPHVIEACLNHRTFRSGVAGTYNYATLEVPMRRAWAAWETHVLAIAEGRVVGDRVVALRASIKRAARRGNVGAALLEHGCRRAEGALPFIIPRHCRARPAVSARARAQAACQLRRPARAHRRCRQASAAVSPSAARARDDARLGSP
jgi:integrase